LDDLGNYTEVSASFCSSRLRKSGSSRSPSGSTSAPMCAIHTPEGARIERPGRFPSGRRALVSSSGARPLHRRGGARVGAARSRCRGAAALLLEAKHQPRPSDPVLAHLRADDREQAVAHTHRAPRAEHGSNSQELPRRADAISKAGVRRLDTGRVVCHGLSREVAILLPRGAVVRSRGYCFQGKESPVGSAAAVAKA